MLKGLRFLNQSYSILKKSNGVNGKPLPNMDIFYLTDQSQKEISFWNDVPISMNGDTLTCCIEVPKQLKNKFQVIKQMKNHPFMQDTRKNIQTKQLQLRYYARFPLFNYGFIPRTWEQNITKDQLGLFGDDDPIDICDLSKNKKEVGDIYRGKVLGAFCLIDQGEVDWKIFTVDEQQAKRQNITDLNYFSPQQIKAVLQWFKTIKVFDGKKPNTIAYNEKIFSKDQSLALIHHTHQQWITLVKSQETIYQELRQKFHMTDFKYDQ